MKAMRRLPSLDSLRVFEAAARHLSVTKASEELHVTQSAISHRISALEDELGTRLFRRFTRRLELTPAGETLAAGMRRGLAEITRAVAALDDKPNAGALTVSVLPSFATRWLVPRLVRFRGLYPDIGVRIAADASVVDLNSGRADLAVRFGTGRYPGLHVTPMMDDAVFPVCSSQLLTEIGPIDQPGDIARFPLLHDDAAEKDGSGADWRSWLQHVGAADVPCDEGQRFNQAVLTLEAAAAGLGLALARRSLVTTDLVTGRLIRVLPHEAPTAFSYYIVCLPANAERPPIAIFRNWLLSEVAGAKAIMAAQDAGRGSTKKAPSRTRGEAGAKPRRGAPGAASASRDA